MLTSRHHGAGYRRGPRCIKSPPLWGSDAGTDVISLQKRSVGQLASGRMEYAGLGIAPDE